MLQIVVFAFALWFGLYLIARNPAKRRLRYTGLGLVAYALALGFDYLAAEAVGPSTGAVFSRFHWALLFFPPLFWAGTTIHLIPVSEPSRENLLKIWQGGLYPLTVAAAALVLLTDLLWEQARFGPTTAGFALFGVINLLPLAATLCFYRFALQEKRTRNARGAILAATLFFTLGAGVIVLTLDWLPHTWKIFAIGFDLELLGLAVVWLDAFDEGEALLPDLIRSLAVSSLAALIFGGQIAVAIAISTGPTVPMLSLLLTIIAASLFITTFADQIQSQLDKLIFARLPGLQKARSDLRGMASALPRVAQDLSLSALDETEFSNLTRRALSNFGDLPRLSSSPLTKLPMISLRLNNRDAPDNTLERAAELKAVLTESIQRLKPVSEDSFGSTDEWRFYNALYFPYVVGLRPYSRRLDKHGLDKNTLEALDWFQTEVPERTLYNWQNAAAKLVAQDIRERETI